MRSSGRVRVRVRYLSIYCCVGLQLSYTGIDIFIDMILGAQKTGAIVGVPDIPGVAVFDVDWVR